MPSLLAWFDDPGLSLLAAPAARAGTNGAPHSAGFFDPVHPPAVAVLGSAGLAWLSKQDDIPALARRLKSKGLRALVTATNGVPSAPEAWSRAGIAVLQSARSGHELAYALRRRCAREQAPRLGLHAVLVEVMGLGVLLRGPSAVGKSELALDLLDRGHRLVADDAVDLLRPAPGLLVGECPPLLHGHLEVRGLGILDVRRLFGSGAVVAQCRVDLVVDLQRQARAPRTRSRERVGDRRPTARLLAVVLPRLSLVAGLGHNLAVLIETACRDTRLRLEGENAAAAFSTRQQAVILEHDVTSVRP